jgi:hypothetical protein
VQAPTQLESKLVAVEAFNQQKRQASRELPEMFFFAVLEFSLADVVGSMHLNGSRQKGVQRNEVLLLTCCEIRVT